MVVSNCLATKRRCLAASVMSLWLCVISFILGIFIEMKQSKEELGRGVESQHFSAGESVAPFKKILTNLGHAR